VQIQTAKAANRIKTAKRKIESESRAERMAREGLPMPELEVVFHHERKWRFDFAWPLQKVALEVHGAVWTRGHHSRGQGQQDDWEKLNEAQLLGWRVFQCSPQQVDSGEIFGILKKAINP